MRAFSEKMGLRDISELDDHSTERGSVKSDWEERLKRHEREMRRQTI